MPTKKTSIRGSAPHCAYWLPPSFLAALVQPVPREARCLATPGLADSKGPWGMDPVIKEKAMYARDPGVVSDYDAKMESWLVQEIDDAHKDLFAAFDARIPDAMADACYDATYEATTNFYLTPSEIISDDELDAALLAWVQRRIAARGKK